MKAFRIVFVSPVPHQADAVKVDQYIVMAREAHNALALLKRPAAPYRAYALLLVDPIVGDPTSTPTAVISVEAFVAHLVSQQERPDRYRFLEASEQTFSLPKIGIDYLDDVPTPLAPGKHVHIFLEDLHRWTWGGKVIDLQKLEQEHEYIRFSAVKACISSEPAWMDGRESGFIYTRPTAEGLESAFVDLIIYLAPAEEYTQAYRAIRGLLNELQDHPIGAMIWKTVTINKIDSTEVESIVVRTRIDYDEFMKEQRRR
jgi:hypothetical protein